MTSKRKRKTTRASYQRAIKQFERAQVKRIKRFDKNNRRKRGKR